MAIDTPEKRRSVAGINRIYGPGVTPNASKDAEWRQQSGFGYSGIAASAGADPFTLDTVCPLPIPLYDRTTLAVPMLARSNLAVPMYDRSTLAVPLVGCRNEV